MIRSSTATLFGAFVMFVIPATSAAEPAEPLLKKVPPGVFVTSSVVIPPQQTKSLAQKMGGDIERLSNSIVQVHGKVIKVNVITASNDASAQAIHQSLLKIKPYPFCLRKERMIVEYVGGKDVDEALATKTSYELGLVPKPATVRYRVTAELATVDRADYMSCNPLFNQFLALRDNQDAARLQIAEIEKKFAFGRQLVLRNPALGGPATYEFQPAAAESKEFGSSVKYSFGQLPKREGIPFVTATMDVTVLENGLTPTNVAPDKLITAATKFWPSDRPELKALADRITAGKTTNDAKAAAILDWLAPGKNLKYSGQTGSRWGTAKVFEQKFGHCWDFSDAFVTLGRAAGVPCRQVAGWFFGSSGHVWAEYFIEGRGWQQVDPTGGGALRCGIYHIAYFTTEDGEMPIVYLAMPKIEKVK